MACRRLQTGDTLRPVALLTCTLLMLLSLTGPCATSSPGAVGRGTASLTTAESGRAREGHTPRRRMQEEALSETPGLRLSHRSRDVQRMERAAEDLSPKELQEDALLAAFSGRGGGKRVAQKKGGQGKGEEGEGEGEGEGALDETREKELASMFSGGGPRGGGARKPKPNPHAAQGGAQGGGASRSSKPKGGPEGTSAGAGEASDAAQGMLMEADAASASGTPRAKGGAEGGWEEAGASEAKGVAGPTETPEEKRARVRQSLAPLLRFPKINASDPIVAQLAAAVDEALAPWRPVEGVQDGMARGRGIISPRILKAISHAPQFMSCCGHIRIVKGELFYRYGGFLGHWYRNRRFILTLKTIQAALNLFQLQAVTAELFVNTCDEPISFDSAVAGMRGGYPIFSTEWRPGSTDILYPDPLDLSKGYMSSGKTKIPWEKRKSKAVFRGATTNYDIHNDSNWRVNPRIRLHKMSEVRPDLLDARLTRWSHIPNSATLNQVVADGLQLGQPVDREALQGYKYELVVDGGGGSCRTCGVLASDRVMIRQDSTYSQFFQPLLKPYVHYIPTKHFFQDTYKQLEWVQQNDARVKAMLPHANRVARWACTWSGRALYWAILLIKYSKDALELPTAAKAPGSVCNHAFPKESMRPPKSVKEQQGMVPPQWPPRCQIESYSEVEQPPCAFFCIHGSMRGLPEPWLSADSLNHIQFGDG